MSTPKARTWRTADGQEIPMENLDASQLTAAFKLICNREFSNFKKANALLRENDMFDRIKENLIEVAKDKGVVLIYPDQLPGAAKKYGKYFKEERKVRAIEVQPSKVVLAADNSVEKTK